MVEAEEVCGYRRQCVVQAEDVCVCGYRRQCVVQAEEVCVDIGGSVWFRQRRCVWV